MYIAKRAFRTLGEYQGFLSFPLPSSQVHRATAVAVCWHKDWISRVSPARSDKRQMFKGIWSIPFLRILGVFLRSCLEMSDMEWYGLNWTCCWRSQVLFFSGWRDYCQFRLRALGMKFCTYSLGLIWDLTSRTYSIFQLHHNRDQRLAHTSGETGTGARPTPGDHSHWPPLGRAGGWGQQQHPAGVYAHK